MQQSNLAAPSCRVRQRHAVVSPSILANEPVPSSLALERHDSLASIAALRVRLNQLALAPEEALDLIAQETLAVTAADGIAIAVVKADAVVCCARAGALAPPLGTPVNTRSGLSSECLRTGKIVRCDDTEADPRVDPEACRQAGIHSVLVVPVADGNRVAGVLAAFSLRARAFSDADRTALELAAVVCSHVRAVPQANTPPTFDAAPPSPSLLPGYRPTETHSPIPARVPRSSSPWVSSGKISDCLDRIRQDPALQVLGRAKAYLTIETLYDGADRAQAIALCQRLMFERAADIGVTL